MGQRHIQTSAGVRQLARWRSRTTPRRLSFATPVMPDASNMNPRPHGSRYHGAPSGPFKGISPLEPSILECSKRTPWD